eukprot:TRINITY_DN9168_c0_g1_i1.p1 TRINITY_DN9168_c0_g1~~TRINITY_DN9168_c0_g1_i1.p1  ORF type:complete len:195 (-),score=25.83 TRINITY_DN9168_c0_g1_i1:155-739(-)
MNDPTAEYHLAYGQPNMGSRSQGYPGAMPGIVGHMGAPMGGGDLGLYGFMGLPSNMAMTQHADETNLNYYQETRKLYVANMVLTSQLKELVEEKRGLLEKITRLEAAHNQPASYATSGVLDDRKQKRKRRTAKDIERHYKCLVESCPKSYGSEGSLAQHIKLKHPGFFYKPGLADVENSRVSEDEHLKSAERQV